MTLQFAREQPTNYLDPEALPMLRPVRIFYSHGARGFCRAMVRWSKRVILCMRWARRLHSAMHRHQRDVVELFEAGDPQSPM